ncbi:AMP-binding protein [Nocardia yamanashiensis]|uniref:AMP-binding protein n=1 Tax=Nocardia yamanashiensis TaxID=209247 RepID=UPI0008334D27|nr:AMP-binding protein [Nocardia yamanashiensis]
MEKLELIRAALHGGKSIELPVASLPAALLEAAERTGGGEIVCLDESGAPRTQSYAELLDDAARILAGMRRSGVRPGERVVIQVAEPFDLMGVFWACQLGGLVAVPVSTAPQSGTLSVAELLAQIRTLLDAEWVVGKCTTGVDSERLLGSVEDLRASHPTQDFHQASTGDLATMLLTSGSTGLPKAVMLTHGNILSRSVATAHQRRLSQGSRTLNWMPLDHVGGLVMFHIRDVLVGCHQVHAPTAWVLADPLRWLDLADAYNCDTTWAPNFAFGLINDRASEIGCRTWDLSPLRYIMNGGEAIKPAVARRFLALLAPFGLPDTAVHPGWGMTETSSGVVDHVMSAEEFSHDRFTPVGYPHPGVSVRVVGPEDRVLLQNQIGRVQVTGEPVTDGYYGIDDASTHFTADGWFVTGDLGFISDGLLTVTGRVDDLIQIDGSEFYGHEIESAVEELPFVDPTFTVACLIDGELTVAYHPRSGAGSHWDRWWIANHISERFGVSAVRVQAMSRESIPKTGMGKLRRTQLSLELRSARDDR